MSRWSVVQEKAFSPVGLHTAGFCLMAAATVFLGIRVGLDWRETSSSNVDAIAGKQARLRTLEIQTAPLRGLDKKVDMSREQIDAFYADRIPASYSAFLERLGQLAAKAPVQLTRASYTQGKGSGDLVEIRMDAGVSGDYLGVMRFINGLERSPTFFVIRSMALSGQQSGTVNLRLQVSTWLRPADASSFPIEGNPDAAPKGTSAEHEPASQGNAELKNAAPLKAGKQSHAGEGE